MKDEPACDKFCDIKLTNKAKVKDIIGELRFGGHSAMGAASSIERDINELFSCADDCHGDPLKSRRRGQHVSDRPREMIRPKHPAYRTDHGIDQNLHIKAPFTPITPFHRACASAPVPEVCQLLDDGLVGVNQPDAYGRTGCSPGPGPGSLPQPLA